jgi:hypothetical protein
MTNAAFSDYNQFYVIEKNSYQRKKIQRVLGLPATEKKTKIRQTSIEELEKIVFQRDLKWGNKVKALKTFVKNADISQFNPDKFADFCEIIAYLSANRRNISLSFTLGDLFPNEHLSQHEASTIEIGLIKFYAKNEKELLKKSKSNRIHRGYSLSIYTVSAMIIGDSGIGRRFYEFFLNERTKTNNIFSFMKTNSPEAYKEMIDIFKSKYHFNGQKTISQ